MIALRHRLTLLVAGTVGVTVVLVAIVAYVALRSELRGQVDDGLYAQYGQVQRLVARELGPGRELRLPPPSTRSGNPNGPAQLLGHGGDVLKRPADADISVPVDDVDREVAAGQRRTVLRDTHAEGVHLRVLTVALPGGRAIQLVRSLANVDSTLARLRTSWIARPPGSATVSTRRWTPSACVSRSTVRR